jgi:hypothetical protein
MPAHRAHRVVSLALSALLLTSLAACGNKPNPGDPAATDDGDDDIVSAENGKPGDGQHEDAGGRQDEAHDNDESDDESGAVLDAGSSEIDDHDGVVLDAGSSEIEDDDDVLDAGSSEIEDDDAVLDAGDSEIEDVPETDGVVVSTPSDVPFLSEQPQRGSCNPETFGAAVRYDGPTFDEGEQPLTWLAICDKDFRDEASYEGSYHEQTNFLGSPLRANWVGVVSFHDRGDYQGTLAVSILEGETVFESVSCRYGYAYTQEQSRASRDDATPPEVVACTPPEGVSERRNWARFGEMRVRYLADGPTGSFVPADGSPRVPVTFYRL